MGENYILILGLLLVFALLSSRVMKLVKLPRVTGYLIIGLLLALVCTLVDNSAGNKDFTTSLANLNSFISSVALGFIALSIGEEFKLSKIVKYGKRILTITFLQAFAAVVFVDVSLLIVCSICHVNLSVALCLGAVATATAPAATIMVINQYKAKGPMVDLLLPVVAFDDAIGLMIFAISTSFAKLIAGAGELSFVSLAVIPLINIFGSLAIGFILGYLMRLFIPHFNSRNNHGVVFIAFTLIGVGLCDLLNKYGIGNNGFEFSNLLTCMMIGATYTNLTKKQDEAIMYRDFELIDRWTPFLFMLFFVLSGAHLVIAGSEIIETSDISTILTKVLPIFITYIILRSLGKYFGCKLGCQIGHQEKKITNNLGICLLPQAGVAIGMANQISKMEAFKVDNLGNIIVTVVLLATLVYELVGPLLTKKALDRVGEIPDINGEYPFLKQMQRKQNIYFK